MFPSSRIIFSFVVFCKASITDEHSRMEPILDLTFVFPKILKFVLIEAHLLKEENLTFQEENSNYLTT